MRWLLLLIPFALIVGCARQHPQAATNLPKEVRACLQNEQDAIIYWGGKNTDGELQYTSGCASEQFQAWSKAKRALPSCDPLDIEQHTYTCKRADGEVVVQLKPGGGIAYLSRRGPEQEAQRRQAWALGEKACAVMQPIYKTGRVKIMDSYGAMYWCNFNRPTLPVDAVYCIDEINGKKSARWPARREKDGWTCYADDKPGR